MPSSVGPNRHGGLITKEIDSVHCCVAQHRTVGGASTRGWVLFLFSCHPMFSLIWFYSGCFWIGLQTHKNGAHTPYPSATMRSYLLLLRLCHVNFLPGLTLDSGHHIYSAASATKPLHNWTELLHDANKRGLNGLTMADQFILLWVGWP